MISVAITNISHTFQGREALKNINLTIPQGQIKGIIGADSAGKTTLLRLIVGLLYPQTGSISTLGYDTRTQKHELTKNIAYMPQKFGLYEDLTVQENLELYANLKKIPLSEQVATCQQLLAMTDLESFTHRLAGKLSGGMKQKLGLACSLLGQPQLLVLDEPSVGVDPISRRELFALVKKAANNGTTVIWSTAYLDEAFNFDSIALLDQGQVIFNGNPYELSNDTQNFEAKVIELMGGYHTLPPLFTNLLQTHQQEFPVEALKLVKKYGDFYAVKDNTFHIKKGEIFGLLGPNGAGKSTSFKMMCGLAVPTEGTAKIMGIDIKENPSLARSFLGYMAQKFSLYGQLSVRENLEFFAKIYGIPAAEQAAQILSMLKLFNLTSYETTAAELLPLGFKQRLSFACALIHRPPILFLDEPTSGVDPVSRHEFWQEIKALAKQGVTVLITTHFMEEAELCGRISLFLNGESIALGTPSELKNSVQAANMEEAFIKIIESTNKR